MQGRRIEYILGLLYTCVIAGIMQSLCNHLMQELLMPLLFCPSRQGDVNFLILRAALMCLVLLLSSLCLSPAVQVSAVEVITPEEMFVENGTDAKLPCTFTSLEVISSAASVSWSFQPEGAATRISVSSACRGALLGGQAESGLLGGSKEQSRCGLDPPSCALCPSL